MGEICSAKLLREDWQMEKGAYTDPLKHCLLDMLVVILASGRYGLRSC